MKDDKTFGIVYWGFLGLVAFAIIGWFVGATIHGETQPEHKVKIEYVVYRNGNAYPKSGVYTVKGKKFTTRYYTRTQKYGGGPNVLEIVDTDDWGMYAGKQCVCVYTGYNDVEVKSLKVLD